MAKVGHSVALLLVVARRCHTHTAHVDPLPLQSHARSTRFRFDPAAVCSPPSWARMMRIGIEPLPRPAAPPRPATVAMDGMLGALQRHIGSCHSPAGPYVQSAATPVQPSAAEAASNPIVRFGWPSPGGQGGYYVRPVVRPPVIRRRCSIDCRIPFPPMAAHCQRCALNPPMAALRSCLE
jgi:hypothetical protein